MSESHDTTTRRDFLKQTGVVGLGLAAGAILAGDEAETAPAGSVPRRKLGKTGEMVSIIGVGGFHIGMTESQSVADKIIHEALDSGINFMDNAWDYQDGDAESRMGNALKGKRDKAFLMTKMCVHGQDAKVGMKHLEDSLKRLKTDHLDLWQIHEVGRDNEPEIYFAKGGAVEALLKAKEQGKVKYIGFTGHKKPAVHLEMIGMKNHPFQTVQLPLNPLDGTYKSFEKQVVPELVKQNIGIIGMKSASGGRPIGDKLFTIEEALRYSLSLPVATVVSGMNTVEMLRQNLKLAKSFKPMSANAKDELRQRCAKAAAEQKYEWYKV